MGNEIGWMHIARWAPPARYPPSVQNNREKTGRCGAAREGEGAWGEEKSDGGANRIGAAERQAAPELMRAQQVNPQLKGHLRGALNGGATIEQVHAVRQVSIQVCRASGMRLLTADDPPGCFGWRTEVQDL